MKKTCQYLSVLLTGILLLSGCGASSKSSYYTAASVETREAVSFDTGYSDFNAQSAPEEAAAYEMGYDLTASQAVTQPAVTDRKLIRTIRLNVETDTFDDLIKQLQTTVAEMAGYIEQSDISGSSMTNGNYPSRRYASITARIPSTRLDQFVQEVEGKGNVTYKSESTEDVTLQYTDLESRKKTLNTEQERIWELLEKADSIESIIALEERLSEIRYSLESMESQLRVYDNQVDYSTVYINIDEVKIFTPTAPESIGERISKGFTANLETAKQALTTLFITFIATIPLWAPLLMIAVVILLLYRFFSAKRKLKRLLANPLNTPDSSEKEGDSSKDTSASS